MLSVPEIFLYLAFPLLLCLANWRIGIVITLWIVFLQDPLRKLVPEQPVLISGLVGVPIALTFLGAIFKGLPPNFKSIYLQIRNLKVPLRLFLGLVMIEGVIALANTGKMIVPVIGIMSYTAPLPVLLLGYYYAKRPSNVSKYMKLYVVASAVMTLGIYLSYLGYDWKTLKSVGETLIAFSPSGEELTLYCGFYRSPEIAAWHSAASVCVLILLFFSGKKNLGSFLSIPLIFYFLIAVFFTGRRKFLIEILIFASIYSFVLVWWSRRTLLSFVVTISAITASFIIFFVLLPEKVRTDLEPYYERTEGVNRDMESRLEKVAVTFDVMVRTYGIFGQGAGIASQGAVGGTRSSIGRVAESGVLKILAEVGVPGLLLTLWMGLEFLIYFWAQLLHGVRARNAKLSEVSMGIASFLLANFPVFLIAKQAYGDPAILSILGFLAGFFLGLCQNPEWRAHVPQGVKLVSLDRYRPFGRSPIPAADRHGN